MRARGSCVLIAAVLLAALSAPRCLAPPPHVTGDVPTADKGTFEWYVGGRYRETESGKPARLLPFTDGVKWEFGAPWRKRQE